MEGKLRSTDVNPHIFTLEQTSASDPDLFLSDITQLFQRQAKENMYPYIYSSPNPEIENDLACGETHYNDLIYNVPDYYLYREEIKILQHSVEDLAAQIPENATIIEFGVGTEIAFRNKTLPLLKATEKLARYVPIDLCVTYLTQAQSVMDQELPQVAFQGIETDFVKNVAIVQEFENPVVFFKGSTITNLRPEQCIDFFQRLAEVLPTDGLLIVGEDSNPDESSLRKAYVNEPLANTMLSVFYRLKRDYAIQDFTPNGFNYRFDWLPQEYCVRHTAVATESQRFTLNNTAIEIQKDDEFHTVSSYKYPIEFFQDMAKQGGLESVAVFSKAPNPMVVHVFKKH
ncbi:L-histidine N(alpha)-methyltransferase [Candidatus Albibeggiatoa sp. nov. NOAA]|uniref:L-histidine N(alpha)-methyltransferase n=1 Tax=Candidatus Albibeggiatoa sp. nov. NOAA TaxID=3162724 RepID=UPI0032FFB295|nr:L-histidine N(alpha)-methyltransferase [Thiotrichaceae bacterium]